MWYLQQGMFADGGIVNLREAFEKLLSEDRYDSTTRLIYADWLEENGCDDEAVEQRRRASREWIDADKWMHNFAKECGHTCINYGEEKEEWVPLTYEMCIKAGSDYINDGNVFEQIGAETARDLMEGEEMGTMFWCNWSVITGKEVSTEDREGSPFSCYC